MADGTLSSSHFAAPRLRRAARLRRSWRRNRLAYLLVLPAVVFMLAVHLIPTAEGVYMAFLKLNIFTFRDFLRAPFVGFENFRSVLFDETNPIRPGLGQAARNTLYYSVITTSATLVGGLAIALLLNRSFPGRRLARTLMMLPWVVPSFVVGILWGFMWQSDTGLVNRLLVDWLHVLDERPLWLLGPNAFWAIVIPSVWRALPFVMLIFLAGLQAIPDELYEAAAIDGASAWNRFVHITLPMLKPLIAIQLLFNVIFSVYAFTIPATMFAGGTGFPYPGKHADLLFTAITRQTFGNTLYGAGAAVSTLLMLLMLVFVAVWYRSFRRSLALT